jgi:phytoene dehydrogenase-like protein
MHPREGSPSPVIVIGAGMSGLTCALHLQERGHAVALLEAGDDVGGRVRTDEVEGFKLDRGFQVLLTAYPEVEAMLDLDRLGLGRFAPGAKVRIDDRFATIADPLRRPEAILSTLVSGVATPMDALRILRLRRRVSRGSALDLLRADSGHAIDALRAQGFSERIITRFFRPFLGGVLLDRELRASTRALNFLFRMFAEGDAALPAEGMGAIPVQLSERLAPGTLRLRARVVRLEARSVTLESGQRIEASAIVVASEARGAASLLNGLDIPKSHPAVCLYFDAPQSPKVADYLVLDGNGEGPINELCVPSAVVPGYAPRGRALISASVLAPVIHDDEELEQRARRQLVDWFGNEVEGWRLLRLDRIPEALPFQPPGSFEPAAPSAKLADGLFICGDHRDLASLHGAMASGRRAAVAVSETLR